MVDRGQYPVFDTDTQAILEEAGYHLDAMNDRLAKEVERRNVSGQEHAQWIGDRIDLPEVFRKARFIGMEAMLLRVSRVMAMPLP